MKNVQMAPRVPTEIKKLAEIKSALNGESLGQYISRLVKEDCVELEKVLSVGTTEGE